MAKELTPEIEATIPSYRDRAYKLEGTPFYRNISQVYIEKVYQDQASTVDTVEGCPVVIYANDPLEFNLLCQAVIDNESEIERAYKLKNKGQKKKAWDYTKLNRIDKAFETQLRAHVGLPPMEEAEVTTDTLTRLSENNVTQGVIDTVMDLPQQEKNFKFKKVNPVRYQFGYYDPETGIEHPEKGNNPYHVKNQMISDQARIYTSWFRFVTWEFEHEEKREFFNDIYWLMLDSSVFMARACTWYVVACKAPTEFHTNEQLKHRDDGPALVWGKNFEQYWFKSRNNTYQVARNFIMHPEKVTHEELKPGFENLELRRLHIEMLGVTRYFELIGDGLKVIDEDTDDQGYPMKLMTFKFGRDGVDTDIQVLEVTCPSTNRVYNLYPVNQNCSNVWEAKASTFNSEKISVRHGDVGLVDLAIPEDQRPSKPHTET